MNVNLKINQRPTGQDKIMSDRHAVQKIAELAVEVGKAQMIIDGQVQQIEMLKKQLEHMQEGKPAPMPMHNQGN
jgi:hypothetical protein